MNIIDNIRRFGKGVSCRFPFFPRMRKVNYSDYSDILEVERLQIKRLLYSISRYDNHSDREIVIAELNLALRLIDIIREDGEARLIGDRPSKFKKSDLTEVNPDIRWELDRYVNTRNARRFDSCWDVAYFSDPKSTALRKDALRVEKAWHLYHRLRRDKMRGWWC